MVGKTVDALLAQKMFLAGAKNLESKKEWINELNVFPVPDGDTGTNMTLTIMSAAKEVAALDKPDFKSLSKAISMGSLRGARGNSGVILSQLFRGFTKEIKEAQTINHIVLANSFERAVETAYKAVMKPKEGTILTVAKAVSEKTSELVKKTDDLEKIIREAIEYGDYVLNKTPEMLPILKQAGVVDSGGQGLMQVLKGAFDVFLGKELNFTLDSQSLKGPSESVSSGMSQTLNEADIKFGYCTEFIIMLEKEYTEKTEKEFKAYLESIGDSLVVVSDDDIVKVHVHTNDPGLAIQKALTHGSLTKIKIDNMREEHHERLIKDAERVAEQQKQEGREKEPPRPYGFIAVSVGEGLSEIFKGLGVDYIIEGGQTMNPSTEDIIEAVDKVNAEVVYVFPNNKNIILAANQAAALTEDKKVVVIPSKTIPQGITALINFVEGQDIEANIETMTAEMEHVKTGEVTYAVRDTQIDGKVIKENDIMGIGDKGIVAVGQSIKDTTLEMIDILMEKESEIVSIYYGDKITEKEAGEIAEAVREKYTDVDCEINCGGQPVYYYIVSIE
ncbi:MAG: DAK2 domain-containing protein [Lachnospiraceae bacterium]|nr:DAK2 domain-containing protein [Lachnospiraceae bacterium]MCI8826446.1 DAK2 domain-containing protein [Lachnospiraceae bacterium]MCI9370604.1 DAK2 domain-containing protein [Lachnospiraceae bacterium]